MNQVQNGGLRFIIAPDAVDDNYRADFFKWWFAKRQVKGKAAVASDVDGCARAQRGFHYLRVMQSLCRSNYLLILRPQDFGEVLSPLIAADPAAVVDAARC